MTESETFNECEELAIKKAAAFLLAERYRARGAPAKQIISILRSSGSSYQKLLAELERRLNKLGLQLKKIRSMHGGKVYERFIVVIDPTLDVPEIKPFDNETMSVLALIIVKSQLGDVRISKLLDDISNFLGNKDKAKEILSSSLKKLERKGIINIDYEKDRIEFTDIGKAIIPPPELIDEMIIDLLAGDEKS